MKINFTETGWKDYLFWEEQDKRILKQINKLITDIERNGYDGIGKPEQLLILSRPENRKRQVRDG